MYKFAALSTDFVFLIRSNFLRLWWKYTFLFKKKIFAFTERILFTILELSLQLYITHESATYTFLSSLLNSSTPTPSHSSRWRYFKGVPELYSNLLPSIYIYDAPLTILEAPALFSLIFSARAICPTVESDSTVLERVNSWLEVKSNIL